MSGLVLDLKKSCQKASSPESSALACAHALILSYAHPGDPGIASCLPLMLQCAALCSPGLQGRYTCALVTAAPPVDDSAILTVSSLVNFAKSPHSATRAAAVRCMAGIHHLSALDVRLPVISRACADAHPLVRIAGLMGAWGVWREGEAKDVLEGWIMRLAQDSDVLVALLGLCVLSALEIPWPEKALFPILAERQRLQANALVHLCALLPLSDRRPLEVLNLLDEFLGHGNDAVVLATVNAMLQVVQKGEVDQELVQSVCRRVVGPLMHVCAHTAYEPAVLYLAVKYLDVVLSNAGSGLDVSEDALLHVLTPDIDDTSFVVAQKCRALGTLAQQVPKTVGTCVRIMRHLLTWAHDSVSVRAAMETLVALADSAGVEVRSILMASPHRDMAMVYVSLLLLAKPSWADATTLRDMTSPTRLRGTESLIAWLRVVARYTFEGCDEALEHAVEQAQRLRDAGVTLALLDAVGRRWSAARDSKRLARSMVDALTLCKESSNPRVRQRGAHVATILKEVGMVGLVSWQETAPYYPVRVSAGHEKSIGTQDQR